MRLARRDFLIGSSAVALCKANPSLAASAFSMVQVGNGIASSVAAAIQTQFLPIGGIGETRAMTMAADGTMIVWNDTTGAWIGNTAVIPGAGPGNYQWQSLINSGNAPSSWLQSPTAYLGWQPSTYSVATVVNNSSLIYMMYNAIQGGANFGILLKSTDRGNTFSLTNYPANACNGNGGGAGQNPATIGPTTVIDPNNNSIVWASDGAQLRVSSDGGSTWNAVNPAGGSGNIATGMCYDPTTPNRAVFGIQGSGLYVTTNANSTTSATWTHIAGSITTPGAAAMGSDGTYYFTDYSGLSSLFRLTTGNVLSTIYSGAAFFGFAVDPNNPARVFLSDSNGGVDMCTSAANTTTPTWTGRPTLNLTDTDAPAVFTFYNGSITTLQMAFDPWTTTCSSSVNLGALSPGGSTGPLTVPAGIPNIKVGRQLRWFNGVNNYFIFTVGSYSGTTLSGTIISTAQGGYLGGPIGGSGTFASGTISAERIYQVGDGVVYYEGFSSTTQNVITCKFGVEGSYICDVKWPIGGNPAMTAEDRGVFQVVQNPWGLTGSTGGAVTGCGPAAGPFQSSFLDYAKNNSNFFFSSSEAGQYLSNSGAKTSTWSKYTNQPLTNNAGPCAVAVPDVIVLADRNAGLFYTQNGSTIAATWSAMPAPAPTSGWATGVPFTPPATMCADRTTVTAPYLFYALNFGDGHVYKISVPASGSPTVTKGTNQIGTTTLTGTQPKLDSVNGHAGHLFYCPGSVDTSSHTYAALFAAHPSGGNSRLAFSSDGGNTWTFLTTTQEVIMFAVNGALVPGGSGYPTIYAVGWCGGGPYGIYQCINFNPASLGSETWTMVAQYGGSFNLMMPISMAADPNQYNRFITGNSGGGAAIFQSPNLTNSWF